MTGMIVENEAHAPKSHLKPASGDSGISEEYLTRRFSRGAKKSENLVCELTRDPGYLHQYYLLRERMFISVWGLTQPAVQKDEYDAKSEVMVARIGNHVIAGCRLAYSNANGGDFLPMEKNGFVIGNTLPEISATSETIVEISRMAVLPEYQDSIAMLEFLRQVIKRGAEKNARYAVALARAPLARSYKKSASLFGLNWKIRGDINIPDSEEFDDARMVLSVIDLAPISRPLPKTKEKAEEKANQLELSH